LQGITSCNDDLFYDFFSFFYFLCLIFFFYHPLAG